MTEKVGKTPLASRFYLGQLRHAYKNALDGCIADQKMFAHQLLGPAVAHTERVYDERDRYKAVLLELEHRGEDSGCIICGRGDSYGDPDEPHHHECVIGIALERTTKP